MSIPKNNANGEEFPELTSEEVAIVARWAYQVHLYVEDLYDQRQEARLSRILQKTDLEKLEAVLKESLLNELEEKEACAKPEFVPPIFPSPLVGLVRDYSKAQPMEKALMNFVLRRLGNLTVPMLVSSAAREYKRNTENGDGGIGQEEEENKMTVEEYERVEQLCDEAERAVERLLDAAEDLEEKEFDYADEKLDEILSSLDGLGNRWYKLFHPKPVTHQELRIYVPPP